MHFPMFIDLTDKLIVVIGGGHIATRRIGTLVKFGCQIKLIAPQLSFKLQELVDSGALEYIPALYDSSYLQGAFAAIGATNDRSVNHMVYVDASAQNVFVNIIDKKEECSFFFPAIFDNEELCGGLISKGGKRHTLVKDTANSIRELLNGGK